MAKMTPEQVYEDIGNLLQNYGLNPNLVHVIVVRTKITNEIIKLLKQPEANG